MEDAASPVETPNPSEAVNIPDEIVPVPIGGVDQERIKKLNKEQTQVFILCDMGIIRLIPHATLLQNPLSGLRENLPLVTN